MNHLQEDQDKILNIDKDKEEFTDLPDSPEDAEKMKPETVTFDLPEVKDIPGQEHIQVMPLGELADTTISSDDEEGVGILDFEEDDEDDLEDDAAIEPEKEQNNS